LQHYLFPGTPAPDWVVAGAGREFSDLVEAWLWSGENPYLLRKINAVLGRFTALEREDA
jgi:hypothetical protein